MLRRGERRGLKSRAKKHLMKSKTAIILLAAFASACLAKNAAGTKLKNVMSQKFLLGASPGYEKTRDFTLTVEEAYEETCGQNPSKTEFSYAIEPVGVVNPFSEVEIKCAVGERTSFAAGKRICAEFFGNIEKSLSK